MKTPIILLSLAFALASCIKKTVSPITITPIADETVNHYSFTIGNVGYSNYDVYGGPMITLADTILEMNAYNNVDTISGGFSLHAPMAGTYTHSNTTSSTQNTGFVVYFGSIGAPNSTFYSKSGIITLTTYDNISKIYSGTFSGIMYLSSNPSYTLALTNGSFYYKN